MATDNEQRAREISHAQNLVSRECHDRLERDIRRALDEAEARGAVKWRPVACGAPEVEASTPRTVYACTSSDYDQRPGTFIKKCERYCMHCNRLATCAPNVRSRVRRSG